MSDPSTHVWWGYEDGMTSHFEWAPAPVQGVGVSNVGYSDGTQLQVGARTRNRSLRFSKVYEITAVGQSKDMEGYMVYNKAASGFYGARKWNFADWYAAETNVMPYGWSVPGAREGDNSWYKIGVGNPTYADVAANSTHQPTRSATYTITTAANATPLTDSSIPYVIVPIPEGYTAHYGVTGSATGTGVVRVESWPNGASSAGATASATLIAENSATRLNGTVAGTTYAYAKFFLSRTSSADSTVKVASIMVQLWPTGVTPTLTGDFIPGEGHTKLQFANDARVEDYIFMFPPQKGISFTLEEVA